jgi:hypothetical protein
MKQIKKPVYPYKDVLPLPEPDDDLIYEHERRKRKQPHNQGGHRPMWDKKVTVGHRVRV